MMDKGGSIEIEESEGEYTIDEILLKDEPRNIIDYGVLTNLKEKNETRRNYECLRTEVIFFACHGMLSKSIFKKILISKMYLR